MTLLHDYHTLDSEQHSYKYPSPISLGTRERTPLAPSFDFAVQTTSQLAYSANSAAFLRSSSSFSISSFVGKVGGCKSSCFNTLKAWKLCAGGAFVEAVSSAAEVEVSLAFLEEGDAGVGSSTVMDVSSVSSSFAGRFDEAVVAEGARVEEMG